MSNAPRIVKNTLILTLGHLVSKGLNLLIVILLIRAYGEAGFGLYSFAMAFVMVFMLLNNLGIDTYLVNRIAQETQRAADILATAVPIIGLFSLLTLGIVTAIPLLWQWPVAEQQITITFAFYLFFDAWSRTAYSVFRAFQRMEFEALISTLERVLLFLATALAFWLGWPLLTLAVLFTAIEALKTLACWVLVRRYFWNGPLKLAIKGAGRLLKAALPFALLALFTVIMVRVDILMLKYFTGTEQIGFYNAARRLVESLTFLPEILIAALFPALSALFVSEKAAFSNISRQSLILVSAFLLPLCLVLWLAAEEIIVLLYSATFSPSISVLRWLSIWVFLLGIQNIYGIILNAMNRQHRFALFAAFALLLNIVLNAILIPSNGIDGAAIATTGSQLLLLLLCMGAVYRYADLTLSVISIAKLAAAGGGMILVTTFLPDSLFWMLRLACGGLTYLALAWVLKIVPPEDLNRIKGELRKRFFGKMGSHGKD